MTNFYPSEGVGKIFSSWYAKARTCFLFVDSLASMSVLKRMMHRFCPCGPESHRFRCPGANFKEKGFHTTAEGYKTSTIPSTISQPKHSPPSHTLHSFIYDTNSYGSHRAWKAPYRSWSYLLPCCPRRHGSTAKPMFSLHSQTFVTNT